LRAAYAVRAAPHLSVTRRTESRQCSAV